MSHTTACTTKLAKLFQSSRRLVGTHGGVPCSHGLHHLKLQASLSTSAQIIAQKGTSFNKIFASFNIYKGKAALSINPVLPRFSKLNSGNLVVQRSGVIMLCFLPAVGERKYDQARKQIFALSPTEVGSLISMGPTDSCEFFHDPSMQSSNAGKVRKNLSIKPHTSGATGCWISLNVVDNKAGINERLGLPLSAGEFAVLKTSCSFALPYIMGWSTSLYKQALIEGSTRAAAVPNPESEWDK